MKNNEDTNIEDLFYTELFTIRKFTHPANVLYPDGQVIYVLNVNDTSGDKLTFCLRPDVTMADLAALLHLSR